ncbi:TonB-dependent receptor [Pedobacter yulinensis]|uniref:TonB-dependent receptor n=1 Tax=Pedobacter yulinensis TaxID=2126353 RepID=A0A2T3HR27_9SPHI|nr:outer membrane beta-barrel family protein [Pedobacter yulinensis]PST84847.1 TonB-dependent receptor [Pedobacter yulinensis]
MRLRLNKVLVLALLICFATVKIFAQQTGSGKVTGKAVDGQTNEPIPYATAVLINKVTKANVRLAQTDMEGNFMLDKLPAGDFTFKLSYVGYQTMVRETVNVPAAGSGLNLGTIKMKISQGNALKDVTITASRPQMQLGIDKKVFSVDQSLVSEGGSASDLLQNVPSVQTDMDGNVSLRGSAGVRVLIDGKPSLIAGGNVAQILQSIPASSIESVELITNPSAKYDAEGQSGIINIVLKKNKKLGLNGSAALTAGNRDNYNAATNLSFQNSKVNLYGNYSYRYGNRLGGGFNNIQYLNSASPTSFANQNTDSRSLDKGHNVKAGIDYNLAAKTVLSFSAGLNVRNSDRNELININQLGAQFNPIEFSNRLNDNNGTGESYDLNLDFSQKFKNPKEELTVNLGFSEGTNDNDQTYNSLVYNSNGSSVTGTPEIQRNFQGSYNKNFTAQADYTLPVGKAGKVEAGYRSQIRFNDNNTFAYDFNNAAKEYFTNYTLSNFFNNKDQVHAVYVNFQNQIKNFGYQVGLRAEDAKLNTYLDAYNANYQLFNTPGVVAYTRLYPSVFLTQKLKGDQQVQLSYSRRVNRPRGWDTNPFLDVSEPLNYRQGNPNLRPEDVHAFELSYSKYWKKITLTSSAYFRQTNDVIQRIRTEPDINGITVSTPQNLTRSLNSGLELISRVDVSKIWNFTANANLYRSDIQGVPAFGIVDNSGFSWNANVTNNINLPYSISLQIRAEYRAPEIMAQGRRNAMYGIDGGAKYDFPNKKASLSLNVRDVFNTRRFAMTTEGNYSIIDFQRYMQGTMANLTFAYRFGKTDFSFKKSPKKNQTEDSRPNEEQF